jgi:ferredoxin
MEVKHVKAIYFSATGTTKRILWSIAKGIGVDDVEHIDLTLPDGARRTLPPFSDELVLLGAPVYGGRLPVDAIHRFKKLAGSETPAVVIVVYGNREFDDALLELKDLAVELGFHPIAAGAFIGEHSFATEDVPIASGRPDSRDVQKAMDFGGRIREKLTALPSPGAQADLVVPGRFPYEGGPQSMAASPVTKEDTCAVCGTCASVCPTGAISIDESVATNVELCIRCCACIKSCPTGARVWEDSLMKEIANWLNENCNVRKEPQVFGIDV